MHGYFPTPGHFLYQEAITFLNAQVEINYDGLQP